MQQSLACPSPVMSGGLLRPREAVYSLRCPLMASTHPYPGILLSTGFGILEQIHHGFQQPICAQRTELVVVN